MISTRPSISSSEMTAGMVDTSVVIDWHDSDVISALPDEVAISAITKAELAAGPHLAGTRAAAGRRQVRLQEAEAMVSPVPFDAAAGRSYGLLVAAMIGAGRKPRNRFADLLITATAHANGLDLYTRNGDDLVGVSDLVRIVEI